jgi:hypothetical protein
LEPALSARLVRKAPMAAHENRDCPATRPAAAWRPHRRPRAGLRRGWRGAAGTAGASARPGAAAAAVVQQRNDRGKNGRRSGRKTRRQERRHDRAGERAGGGGWSTCGEYRHLRTHCVKTSFRFRIDE